MTQLQTGESIPPFSLQEPNGKIWTNKSIEKNRIIFYFQPQISEELSKQIELLNRILPLFPSAVQFLGINSGNPAIFASFIREHKPQYPVLIDPQLHCARAFGVWEAFKSYHKSYMNIIPSLFFVNEDGIITDKHTHVYREQFPLVFFEGLHSLDFSKKELESIWHAFHSPTHLDDHLVIKDTEQIDLLYEE